MLQQPVDGFTGTFDHVWSAGHVAIPKLIGEAVRENVREAHFFNVQTILFSSLIARKTINSWKCFVEIMRAYAYIFTLFISFLQYSWSITCCLGDHIES